MAELTEEQVESVRNALAEFETHDPSEERLHGLFKELLDITIETRRAALQALHRVELLEKKKRARGKTEPQPTRSYLGNWVGCLLTNEHLRITVVDEGFKKGRQAVQFTREGGKKTYTMYLSSLLQGYDRAKNPQLKGRS